METTKPNVSSFLIELKSDILLEAKINKDVRVDNDRLVQDAADRLDELIESKVLSGGSFLAVTGSCSIPVGYVIATKLGHLYGAIAVALPPLVVAGKLENEPNNPRYVVAISHSPSYHIGDIVELNDVKVEIRPDLSAPKADLTTYFIALEEGVLQVDFNQLQPTQGDRLVRDACDRLAELVADKTLTGGELLKINGPCSLIVSYAIAHKVCHLFKAIAVFDPKMDRYVVVKTTTSSYALGQTLFFQPDVIYPRMRVVLCGPPNSGKTCLRDGLKKAISALNAGVYPYFITGHPDGEGCYTAEINHKDAGYGELLKRESKRPFTDQFVKLIARWVSNANQPLTLVDVGGEPTPQNKEIMGNATHAILLYRDSDDKYTDGKSFKEKTAEWREFLGELSKKNPTFKVIAEIRSERADADRIEQLEPMFKGVIHDISKKTDISERETVKALAKTIVEMVLKQSG